MPDWLKLFAGSERGTGQAQGLPLPERLGGMAKTLCEAGEGRD